jgi:hypothetical protein
MDGICFEEISIVVPDRSLSRYLNTTSICSIKYNARVLMLISLLSSYAEKLSTEMEAKI